MLLTRNLRFRIRATPAQTLTTLKFCAEYDLPPLHPYLSRSRLCSVSGIPRLIQAYSHTAETHRKPIHFPTGLRQSQPAQRIEKQDL